MRTGDAYHGCVSATSTVKIPAGVHDRLRTRARRERLSQAALIDAMLAQREDAEFWAALAASPRATEAELDEADEAFLATVDDGALP